MKEVKLLDCTLRDGGYINDWEFGKENINWIIQKLQKANLDIIELGYIRDYETFNPDRTIFPDIISCNEILKHITKTTLFSAMIDYGHCSIDKIADKKNSLIDIIRITFRKNEIDNALEFCQKVKDKGYLVFLQPVSVTSYSDKEMLLLIEKINELKPMALSIVDSYGLMHEEKVIRYFHLMDNNLLPEIGIAYHSHNNFQLAYSNSIKFINIPCKREIYVDASLYGMGKNAGNCNIELIAMYLNNIYNKNYDLNELLDIIDIEILKMTQKHCWGYQLPLYVSSMNNCHPNYVHYLIDKNMLTISEISKILKKIPKEKQLIFDKDYIENLYINDQCKHLISYNYQELSNLLNNKTILLLGSGISINKNQDKIKQYIKANNPITISLNHLNKLFDTDYIFISNPKRYASLKTNTKLDKSKLIVTSNIIENQTEVKYILNWADLFSRETIVGNSSIYLLLKALINMKVQKVILAGFDGFQKYAKSYYDSNEEFYKSPENISLLTEEIGKQIKNFSNNIKIEFLTKSLYQNTKGEFNDKICNF